MDADRNQTDSSEDTDLDLIKRLALGDENALRTFYRRYGRFVYSLAMSVLNSEMDAEEVTQEAFLRVWKHARSFDSSRSTVKGWLAMLTRRVAIDRTRSRGYKARKREVTVVAEFETTPAAGPEAPHLQSHRSRRVRKAMADLDESHQVLLRLSYFEGRSHSNMAAYEDATQLLGKPTSAGTFTVTNDGSAMLSLEALPDSSQIAAFEVTIEPVGGQTEPTGMMYLTGPNTLQFHR